MAVRVYEGRALNGILKENLMQHLELTDIAGIGPKFAATLSENNFTVAIIAKATPEQLCKIMIVGMVRAAAIIASAQALVSAPATTNPVKAKPAEKKSPKKSAKDKKKNKKDKSKKSDKKKKDKKKKGKKKKGK